MSEVVLIRPGCTDFDEQHRIQGMLDLPLNHRGEVQVDSLVEELQDLNLEVIYTSSCEPARSTAETIGESLGIPVKESEGLRNFDQGLWQGLRMDDIRRKYPKVFKQWQESPETICPPEGETVREAVERIRKSLQKPIKKKSRFGVVASEPLATLIGCVVRGCKSGTPGSICGDADFRRVEILKSNINDVDCASGRLPIPVPSRTAVGTTGDEPSTAEDHTQ